MILVALRAPTAADSAPFLVVASVLVLAVAHGARRQESVGLARVREGAVVVVEEHVERQEEGPHRVEKVLDAARTNMSDTQKWIERIIASNCQKSEITVIMYVTTDMIW